MLHRKLLKAKIVVPVDRDFVLNGRRKYDGEMSDDVPFSFAYSFLAVQSNLTVKIVAPEVPDNSKPSTIYIIIYNNQSHLQELWTMLSSGVKGADKEARGGGFESRSDGEIVFFFSFFFFFFFWLLKKPTIPKLQTILKIKTLLKNTKLFKEHNLAEGND